MPRTRKHGVGCRARPKLEPRKKKAPGQTKRAVSAPRVQQGRNRRAASRYRDGDDMDWRSSCSPHAGESRRDRCSGDVEESLKGANNDLGRTKVDAQASASRQTEIAWTRHRRAVGKVVQAHDRSLDVDGDILYGHSCGLSPIIHAMGAA